MIKCTLNKKKAEEIFTREAVLIGDNDVIPSVRALKYLGKGAIEFAFGIGKRNAYGTGKGVPLEYLYRKGFEEAVTYHNITILQGEEDEHKN